MSFDPSANVRIAERYVELTWQHIVATQVLPFNALRNGTFTPAVIEPMHMAAIYRLSGMVLSRCVESVKIEYPKDWWQALRGRFAPTWWLKRHPVLMTTRTFEAKEIFPHCDIGVPKLGPVVRMMVLDGTEQIEES